VPEGVSMSSTEAVGTTLPVVSADWLTSRAVVTTAKPSSYLLQLARHFRRKLDVRFHAHEASSCSSSVTPVCALSLVR